ncbi:hypothetical protein Tco_0117040 [Tanacetum coccineum]
MPKYSTKPFDDDSLKEYDQKTKLMSLMMKSTSYKTHPAHPKLYDALMDSLLVDDDDMDKWYSVQPTQKKRCHDHQDPLEDEDNDMTKKRRKDTDTSSSKKGKDQAKSSKEDKNPSEPLQTKKAMDADESIQDAAVDAEEPTQDVAARNQDMSKWFKQDVVERPETLDPDWFKEPNVNDAPEQNWFNEMKDKLTKAYLEGPTFAILKGNFKNNVELEYNLEQCYLALTDQIDWVNPEGGRRPYDLTKTLPLQEIVVRRVDQKEYIFNEADFPRLHLNDIEDITIIKNKVEDVQLGVKSYQTKLNITMPQTTYDGLKFKEPYTIVYEPRGVVYQNKSNRKILMRADKLYKVSNGMLKLVHDNLDSMLHNFILGNNNQGMPNQAWSVKDQKRTTSMLKKIDKTLLERRIMQSRESFAGGRRVETDYRLLMRTK